MKETYCIKDKTVTPCVEPSGYQTDKNGREQFYCHCAVCGIKKVRYVKSNESGKKRLKQQQGKGIMTDIGGVVRLVSEQGLQTIAQVAVDLRGGGGGHGVGLRLEDVCWQVLQLQWGLVLL